MGQMASDAGHSRLSVATSLVTSFQLGKGGLPCPQAVLWKVLPACFFLNSIAFHHGGWGGLRWVVNYLQHSYLVIHFMLETTWVSHVVYCPSCSQSCFPVLMLQFSVVASSHCCRGKSVWEHPKAPLMAKHQLYFSFMGSSFPNHSHTILGSLATFLSPRCIWKRFSAFLFYLSQNLFFFLEVAKFHLLVFMSFIFTWLQLLLFDSCLFKSYAVRCKPALLFLLGNT